MKHWPRAARPALLAAQLALAPPALADGPEQFEQLEPGRGGWQIEYSGAYGGRGTQAIELLGGLSDAIAIGVEAEVEGKRAALDSAGPVVLLRFSDPDEAPIGLGLKLQGGLGRGGRVSEAEARVIAERRRRGWWLQGNLIVRHLREEDGSGTAVAYGASLARDAGGGTWIGIEASGQATRLGGTRAVVPAGNHYIGPSLTLERRQGRADIELGGAWLQRVGGDGPGSGPRVFAQLTF